MQIAEQVVKSGVTGSEVFCDALYDIITEAGATKVIETGTHKGEGTTSAILKALTDNKQQFDFYTIEVNPKFYALAKRNLGSVSGLHMYNGQSVDKSQIPVNSTFDVPDHVIVDHYPENRNEMYMKEVAFNVPDNMLELALSNVDYQPHLVLLDSAGNMGLIEFHYLMQRVKGPFILALDDTGHVKHYQTMLYIRQHPEKFTVIWEVESQVINSQSGSKFGSAIIQVR